MFTKGLVALVVALENSAIGLLFLHLSAQAQMLLFTALHGSASVLAALLTWRLMPRAYRQPKAWVLVLLTSFSLFIPVLGLLGMLTGAVLLLRHQKRRENAGFRSVGIPTFTPENQPTLSQFGEGGVRARLLAAGAPTSGRLKALLAMGASGSRNANEIFRMVLGDNDDEVRLLAFGLLDAREREINRHIHGALQQLKAEPDATEQARLRRQLAFSYWELVYQELAQDELMRYTLEQSLRYAQEAVAVLADDAGLWILLGRIQFRQGNTDAAEEAFTRALALGGPGSRILPYLAELAFATRDFRQLRALLKRDPAFLDIPTLGPVARFWSTQP